MPNVSNMLQDSCGKPSVAIASSVRGKQRTFSTSDARATASRAEERWARWVREDVDGGNVVSRRRALAHGAGAARSPHGPHAHGALPREASAEEHCVTASDLDMVHTSTTHP